MTTPSAADAFRAIRERLLVAARDRSWFDLWPGVVAARLELIDAIAPVSEEQAQWKPAAEAWSIEETIRHLLVSSRGVVAIIDTLAAGRDPGAGAVYDSPGDLTAHQFAPPFEGAFADLRAAFVAHSVDFAALPSRLPSNPLLEPTFEHMYFGPLPAVAWFAFQRIHDGAHLRQLREIGDAPGYPD